MTGTFEEIIKEEMSKTGRWGIECAELARVCHSRYKAQLEKQIEQIRLELVDLVKSDKHLEEAMSKIQRTPYEVGYADAAYKGRMNELQRVESILRILKAEKTEQ